MYIFWPGYVIAYRDAARATWLSEKGHAAELWAWVDKNIPPDATVAYTNLYMIHPLLGFDHRRTLAYAPTRPGVHAYHDLPPSRRRVSDQQIRALVAELLTQDANRGTWLANLATIHPQYLIVGHQDVLARPPEQEFADHEPQRFEKMREMNAGTVYRVLR